MLSIKKHTKKIDFNEDDMKAVAMSGAYSYIKKHLSDGTFNMNECMDCELESIKNEYKRRAGGGRTFVFTSEDFSFLTSSFLNIRDELTRWTEDKLLQLRKDAKLEAINATTAKAVIEDVLDRSGLQYQITRQRYRLKVQISLERNSFILLHIHYKDLVKKNPTELLPTLQALNSFVSQE